MGGCKLGRRRGEDIGGDLPQGAEMGVDLCHAGLNFVIDKPPYWVEDQSVQ
jgi:hypothetical protein